MKRTRRGCSIFDCEKIHRAKGFCAMHWARICRYGDATVVHRLAAPKERFWLTVKVGAYDECWPWLNKLDSDGYGRFYAHNKGLPIPSICLRTIDWPHPSGTDDRSSLPSTILPKSQPHGTSNLNGQCSTGDRPHGLECRQDALSCRAPL